MEPMLTFMKSTSTVVFQLDRYENNMITLDILVEELSYQKLNKQYFFGTEKAISKLIRL